MALIYTPGAYLHTYVDKYGKNRIIILFEGKLEELMVMVNTNLYRKYVNCYSKVNSMFYVEMNKALYGLL